ncbi:ABC transporter substrate-binding protein [Chakrabartyella piscis]|uniref:ABC transporter substrate-binding protein n=1 Tax=Chakrabartyella piscis TaxID=2918914 RepID=UPI00295889B2|nr:ABC transporter substrate-binding protein [Chakrabartyella piscis]
MRKKILLGLLFMLSMGITSACGGNAPTEEVVLEELEVVEEAVAIEKTIQVADGDDIFHISMGVPTTLNPLWNEEESVDRILRLIYQPLVQLDASGKVVEGIATNWTHSSDGTYISLDLRSDIVWENGSSLTAYDVAYSLDTIALTGENSVYHSVLDYVSGYNVTGNNSINIYFHESFSGNIVALQFPIISKSYYGGSVSGDDAIQMKPMGSGPYMMESYTTASSMELVANPYYADGPAHISKISVNITNGNKTDVYAFDQGMLDAVVMEAIGTGRYAKDEDIHIHSYATRKYDFAGFQFGNVLFQDKDMRKVFAYTLPRDYIKESIYLQYADIAYTPVSSTSWLYEENTMNYAYDKQMAATLLKNLGWSDLDGNGTLEDAEGNPLEISILVNEENATRMQIAKKWVEELQLLGIAVTLDAQPFDVYSKRVETGTFDIFLGGWEMSAAMDLYDFFGTEGQYNYIGYVDLEMEALIAEANVAVGEGATLLAYSDLQKKIAEELPYISIAYRQDALFLTNRISGSVNPVVDDVYTGVANWVLAP